MLAVVCVCVTNKGVCDQQTAKKEKEKRKTGQGRMLSEEGVAKRKKNVGGRRGREWRPALGRGALLMISPPAVGLGRSRRREREGGGGVMVEGRGAGREEQWQGKQNGL